MDTILVDIQNIYLKVIGNLPGEAQPFVSLILGIVLAVAVLQVLKKNFIWIIVLIVLLPASLSILKGIAELLVSALKYLFGVS
jgi:hypothetical protein